jgi:hypothetical protein
METNFIIHKIYFKAAQKKALKLRYRKFVYKILKTTTLKGGRTSLAENFR